MRRVALTFEGNPYSPIDQFDEWYAFDPIKAERTCSLLARIAVVDSDMPQEVANDLVEEAIDEICDLNVEGYFKKYVSED